MGTGEAWASVDFNSRDPVYLQVVRHFKEQIATGKLQAGQVIPSRRELGTLMKINPNTAQKAYKEMEEQQLIVTEGNSPSRITGDEEVLRAIRSELIGEAVDAFVASVRKVNVPVEELLDLVRSKYTEETNRQPKSDGGGTSGDQS
ncbi:GntR family transcriptional regulator [Paenibacillus pinihumi]|uniref:GntR family transcriptional regulator n=1 Tax=Paenibacillus pinihumi TaxID=669462 RepID=UPI0003F9619C|nr:GntR family transcriptional regulator [Paenibacillus pinihumi]